MNSNSSDVLSLHRIYNDCLKAKMAEWVSQPAAPSNQEWCTTEKANYFNCMKDKKPVEYANMMRLEENNFWISHTGLII